MGAKRCAKATFKKFRGFHPPNPQSPTIFMIFFLFTLLALAQEPKTLWKKDFSANPSAVYFDVNSQKIFLALNQKSGSNLWVLDKQGKELAEKRQIKGFVEKIFSFDGKIFVATERELISFDSDLNHRKKEKSLSSFFDLQITSKGDLLTADNEGVFLWKAGERTKIFDKKIETLFFDVFEPMGVDFEGTVWKLQQGKKADFRFPKRCSSVWKYNELWLCISEDTVIRSNSTKPLLSFRDKILGFGFGYQKEEKDLFWLLVFDRELRAISPVIRK